MLLYEKWSYLGYPVMAKHGLLDISPKGLDLIPEQNGHSGVPPTGSYLLSHQNVLIWY